MREKIAGVIPADCEGCVDTGYECGIEPDPCGLQVAVADQILTLICEEIEKVENPYEDTGRKSIGGLYELSLERLSFEECRQKILSLLQGKAKPPKNIIGSVDI